MKKHHLITLISTTLALTFAPFLLSGSDSETKTSSGLKCGTLLFDLGHGQSFFEPDGNTPSRWMKAYVDLLGKMNFDKVEIREKFSDETFNKTGGLLTVLMPTLAFEDSEIEAIESFVAKGGSALFVLDEQVRQKLELTRMNDVLMPFGMQLTGDTAYIHNRGAVAKAGVINKEDREIPYSGGRAVVGGIPFSYILDTESEVHSAYYTNDAGGRVVVMAEGMASLLLGEQGVDRLTGSTVENTRYWGGDSQIFMTEVFFWLAGK